MKYIKNYKSFLKMYEDAYVNDDDNLNGNGVINNANTNPSATTTSAPTTTTAPTTPVVLNDISKKQLEIIKSNNTVPYLEKGMGKSTPKNIEYIKLLQNILNIKPDGDFGDITYKNVYNFQTINKLEKDGKVGQQTWIALLKLVGITLPKINITKDNKPVVSKGSTSNIKISNLKKGETITDISSLINEQLSDFKGVSMTIDTPLYKDNNNKSYIVAKFSKNGKNLNYGTDTTGKVKIPIDSTTDSFVKGIKQDLLNNLTEPTTTSQTKPSTTKNFNYDGAEDVNFTWTKENVISKYNVDSQDFRNKMFNTIISNNNKDSILLLNQMLWDNKKETLITFFNSVADISTGYDSAIMDNPTNKKAFGIVLDYIAKPINDATVIYHCLDGVGTSEETLFYLFDKREKMKVSEEYKKNVAIEYEKKYNVQLAKDINEDFPGLMPGSDEHKKILKFIPSFKNFRPL